MLSASPAAVAPGAELEGEIVAGEVAAALVERHDRSTCGNGAQKQGRFGLLAPLGRDDATRLQLDQPDRPGAAAGILGEQGIDRGVTAAPDGEDQELQAGSA
jgi:hypothetical protein